MAATAAATATTTVVVEAPQVAMKEVEPKVLQTPGLPMEMVPRGEPLQSELDQEEMVTLSEAQVYLAEAPDWDLQAPAAVLSVVHVLQSVSEHCLRAAMAPKARMATMQTEAMAFMMMGLFWSRGLRETFFGFVDLETKRQR